MVSRGLLNKRMLQFGRVIRWGPEGLEPLGIEGWRPVFLDPVPPVDYIVFEVLPEDEQANSQ